MASSPTRRAALLALAGAAAFPRCARADDARDRVGAPLSPWRRGELDIHVLSTGRGDCCLVVTPTGKTLLIDAGAVPGDPARMVPVRPVGTTNVGAAIARYVRRRLRDTGTTGLDVLWTTHLHADHVSGVPDLAAELPIGRLIDPDFPNYRAEAFEGRAAIQAYVDFVRRRAAEGGRVECFEVGRADQFGLEPVEIRALASRGTVWTGEGDRVRAVFSPRRTLTGAGGDENASSGAIRLRYGAFRAFFGGDLTDWADAGAQPGLDALTPAAEVCGPVDFALAPHHGLYDAQGPAFVRALRPQVWAISAWHETHPSPSTLDRLLNPRLNPNLKAVFATSVGEAAAMMARRLLAQRAGASGHIVARVDDGGTHFRTVVVNDADETDTVASTTPVLRSGMPSAP